MAMIKAVKEFWEKAIDEEKQIKTVFTGSITVYGNIGTTEFKGRVKIRSPQDENLVYNFKNQLKARDLVFKSEDRLVFDFSDMGTGAEYTLVD